jgi:ADP-heptose:LPS heptosyltransferase
MRTTLKIAAQLRRERFDMIVLFSAAESAWLLAQLSAARTKVGFTRAMGGRLLTVAAPWTRPPSTANNLRLIEAIGCEPTRTDYVGFLTPESEDREAADGVLSAAGVHPGEEFIVLSQGTSKGRELKSWTNEGFASVADRLVAKYHIRSVVVGLDGGEAICALSRNAVDLTGRTSLPTLAAVLDRAKLFAGIDSGVMHLSAAMGTPVVGLFGPSDPEITGPQGMGHRIVRAGLKCSPCFGKECEKSAECMKSILPDEVRAAVDSILLG